MVSSQFSGLFRLVKRTALAATALLVLGAAAVAAFSLAGGAPKPAVSLVSKSIACDPGMPVQVVRLGNRGGSKVPVEITVRLIRNGETVGTAKRRGRITGRSRTFRIGLGSAASAAMPYCRLLAGSKITGVVVARNGDQRRTVKFSTVGRPQRAVTSRIETLGAAPAPLTEASGLAESRSAPGIFWSHNDSGGAASLYALDKNSALLATQPVSGVVNTDWEDIALGPAADPGDDALYVGDIGDNAGARSGIRVYRIREPDLTGIGAGAVLPAALPETLSLVYPDGARDAEALVVDPVSGDVFVITKREPASRIYVVRNPVFDAGSTVTLEFLGELDAGGVVAADACPDGETVLVKTYFGVSAYVDRDGVEEALTTQSGQSRLYSIDLGFPQDESVAADPFCTGYSTLPEGASSPLRRFTP